MVKWIGEWFSLSVLIFCGIGGLLILWTAWPNLVQMLRVTNYTPNLEAFGAIALLGIVVVGYLKLVFSRS